MNTNDIRIGVINFGRGPKSKTDTLIEPTWFWDGKPYTYEVSTPGEKQKVTVVPYEVARHHWAIEIDPVTGALQRATTPRGDEDESLFADRLSGLCPKKFVKPIADIPGHYTDDPEYVDWYTNGVTLKMKQISHRMTAEEFMRS